MSLPAQCEPEAFSWCPPNSNRIAEQTLSANSALPRLLKRSYSAAVSTCAGGALGGFATVVYSLCNQTISFQMGYRMGMDAFIAAVLGGIGNLPGAVLGGILIGVTRSMSDQYVEARWTNTVVFGILILILVFRPSGLLGARLREKV